MIWDWRERAILWYEFQNRWHIGRHTWYSGIWLNGTTTNNNNYTTQATGQAIVSWSNEKKNRKRQQWRWPRRRRRKQRYEDTEIDTQHSKIRIWFTSVWTERHWMNVCKKSNSNSRRQHLHMIPRLLCSSLMYFYFFSFYYLSLSLSVAPRRSSSPLCVCVCLTVEPNCARVPTTHTSDYRYLLLSVCVCEYMYVCVVPSYSPMLFSILWFSFYLSDQRYCLSFSCCLLYCTVRP